ncbi:MAG: YkgJ family cysteine cluster protein, partial [Polyangiaceae bacterium]
MSSDKMSLDKMSLGHLCQSCGLCCDGSLFGRARLAPDEVGSARKHRLRVVASEGSFEQPCSALVDRACMIYDARPRACHAFTCRLYERHVREGGPLEARTAIVARVRALFAELEARSVLPDHEENDPRVVELVAL